MASSARSASTRKIVSLLASLAFIFAVPAHCAQQLVFATPLPSTQLLGGTVGFVTVNVLNANGQVAGNSSAQITMTVTGPQNYFASRTNTATNGVAVFNFTSAILSQTGLYSLAATSGSLVPAFQSIGVEVSMMPPQGSIFAGVFVNPSSGPQDIQALEASCGRTLALSMHYYTWTDMVFASVQSFTNAMAGDATNNRIPLISWAATNLSNIVSGGENYAITNAAMAIAGFRGPILLRWFWEMNLNDIKSSLNFGYPTNGYATPGQVAAAQTNFVACWQMIREIFDSVGAFNVIWLWNPGAGNDSAPGQSAGGYTDAFYPGDAYVDWIGLDAYNRKSDAFIDTYTTDAAYGYANMSAHSKPLLIGETGAYNTNEPQQITFLDAAANTLQTNLPQLLGFMYFDAAGNDDWTLTTEGATNGLTEFSNMVNSPYLDAGVPHQLNYSQYHPFNARVHIAVPFTYLPGSTFTVGVSVGNLSTNTPTGTVAIYCDTNFLAAVALSGGSNGYCQAQTKVTVTNAGPHSLIAVYSGDAHNSAGQSWPVQINITSPPLTFQSVSVSRGTVTFIWDAVSNQSYQVQFSTNLAKGVWTSLGPPILATNSAASTMDTLSGVMRFYRLQTSP